MSIQIRLTRSLYTQVQRDLERPHPFAAERVGFARAKTGNRDGEPMLVLLSDYRPVPDDQYVFDPECGARINSSAIRTAMQQVLDSGDGMFHVHMHPHRGRPRLSPTDRCELPKLIASFRAVGPQATHGIFLLSFDQCVGFAWLPGSAQIIEVNKVSVVGFPMGLMS